MERIIESAIPLWNQTLTPLKTRHRSSPRINYYRCVYDPDSFPEEIKPQQLPNEDGDDYLNRLDEWLRMNRKVVKPEPGKFALPRGDVNEDGTQSNEEIRVDLNKEFSESGLQIIVKLTNIHLTPEKPNYMGGDWHVESQLVRDRQLLR
jgi:Protein of unknown function (DUF4246)